MQQINLWQPILRRERRVFSAAVMLQTVAAALALMLLLYGWNVFQLNRLQQQLGALRSQEQALAARVGEAARSIGNRPESRDLRRTLEDRRRERDGKRRLAAVLANGGAHAASGFAETLAALARHPLPGLWLTSVAIEQEQEALALSLQGRAERGELVPRWVQALGSEASFQGARFRYLHLATPEEGGALSFHLATQAPEDSR